MLSAVAGGCVALHFLFIFVFPHIFNVPRIFGRTWGFHFIAYFSLPFQIAFYALSAALCVPRFTDRIAERASQAFPVRARRYLTKNKEASFVIIAVFSVIVFHFLNSKYAFLGDNFGIVERAVNNTFMRDEFGAIFVLHCFCKVMHALFSMDGIASFHLFSNVCGGFFIYVALRIADEMGRTFFEKTSIFLFYVIFCTIQHFCGYIEDYASTVMLLPLYLFACLLCLKGKMRFAFPAICLIAAIILHLESLMFSPAILYVLYQVKLKKYAFFHQPLMCASVLSFVSVPAFYLVWKLVAPYLMPIHSDQEMTMFSFTHLWEYLNSQLLGCGPGLLILAGCLAIAIKKRTRLTPEIRFLILTSAIVIMGLFVYHSALGSSDWDIYSYSSLAVNLLAICLFYHLFGASVENARFVRQATVVFMGLMLLHSAPWIAINVSDKSIRRFEDIIMSDPAFGWKDYMSSGLYRPRICRIAQRMDQNGLISEEFNLYKKAYEADTSNVLHSYNYFVQLCYEKEKSHALPILLKIAQEHPGAFIYRFRQILIDARATGDEELTSIVLLKLFEIYGENSDIMARLFSRRQLIEYFRQYFELLLKKNTPNDAMRVCKTILSLDPNDGANQYNLARVYFEKGEYDSVIAICVMLNRAFPGMPLPNTLGAEAFRRKQASVRPQAVVNQAARGADDYLKDRLPYNSDMSNAQNDLGVACEEQGRIDEAIGHYDEALRINSSNDKVYFNYRNALAHQGKLSDAIAKYREALRLNPVFADAHNNMGNALAQTGQIDESIIHFREALRLRPDLNDAQKNLAHALKILKSSAR